MLSKSAFLVHGITIRKTSETSFILFSMYHARSTKPLKNLFCIH